MVSEQKHPVKIEVIQNDPEIEDSDFEYNENNASGLAHILKITVVDDYMLKKISKITSGIEKLSKSEGSSIIARDLCTRGEVDEFKKLLQHYTELGITCSVFMIPKMSIMSAAVKNAEAIIEYSKQKNTKDKEEMGFESVEENATDVEFSDAENFKPSSPPEKIRHSYYPKSVSEIEMSDFMSPNKTKIVLNFIKSDDEEKAMKIKNLVRENMLLKKRIESLTKLK